MKKLLALSGLALAVSTTAHAVEQPYLGVAYAQTTFSDDVGGEATPGVAQIRFGTELSRNLGVRAVVSVNAGSDSLTNAGVTYDFTVDSMYTVSAVLRMPFGEHTSVYGHLGYSYAQVNFGNPSVIGFSAVEDNLDGMAYGVGIVLPAFKGFNLEVDYTSYLDGVDTLGGLGIGIRKYL